MTGLHTPARPSPNRLGVSEVRRSEGASAALGLAKGRARVRWTRAEDDRLEALMERYSVGAYQPSYAPVGQQPLLSVAKTARLQPAQSLAVGIPSVRLALSSVSTEDGCSCSHKVPVSCVATGHQRWCRPVEGGSIVPHRRGRSQGLHHGPRHGVNRPQCRSLRHRPHRRR